MTELRLADYTDSEPYHAALIAIGQRDDESPGHSHHDFWELFYVLEGRGAHQLEGRPTTDLEAGDLILVRPGDCHHLAGLSPIGLRWINVAFPAGAWRTYLSLVAGAAGASWERAELPPKVSLSGEDAERVELAFRRALLRFQRTPTAIDLIRLWTDAVEALTAALPGFEDAHDRAPSWLAGARRAMEDEPNLQAGLGKFQALAGVSPGYLARLMRRYYGVTPISYVTDVRLRHAASLLATTFESITEISLRCGFSSQSHFANLFRRAYGVSPRRYRAKAHAVAVPLPCRLREVTGGDGCSPAGSSPHGGAVAD